MNRTVGIIGAIAIAAILVFMVFYSNVGYAEEPWEASDMSGSWGLQLKVYDKDGNEHIINPAKPAAIKIGEVYVDYIIASLHCKATPEIAGEINTVTFDFSPDGQTPFQMELQVYTSAGVLKSSYTTTKNYISNADKTIPTDGEFQSVWNGPIPVNFDPPSTNTLDDWLASLSNGDYYIRMTFGGIFSYVTDAGTTGTLAPPSSVALIYFSKTAGGLTFDWDVDWTSL